MAKWASDDDRGGLPVPGYFAMKLVRGGPLVPARITLEEGLWQASIDGKPGLADPDPAQATGVYRIWHSGQRSTPEIHAYLEAVKAWAGKCNPNHPALNPYQPIDNTLLAPVIP